MFKILFINSSYASAKINVILDFLWTSRILIKCLPFIDIHMGRVHDVTHCYNQGKKCVPPC